MHIAREKSSMLMSQSFNQINFGLFKKAMNEMIDEYIIQPAQIPENELQDHYPAWSTIFEAKDDSVSDLILENVDALYEIGIGVIDATDYTNASLFIAGAGYDFYSAHWIPLFIKWNWINPDSIMREIKEARDMKKQIEKIQKLENLDAIESKDLLYYLLHVKNSKNPQISRHATGLLIALKM